MTRLFAAVSQCLVDMIVHELWYNFCVCGLNKMFMHRVVGALMYSYFFLHHLDAYNEMVVCVIISYVNGRCRCVFTMQTLWHD